ncbi:MAG: pilus assembly protein PilM [Planctomycetaceae bacterium]|nr:pilus assembly protein PilM [Planctomycetaceae bacterium]
MAKSTAAVWGIDIGNSSLKALRCRLADEEGKIEVLAFDFIEHSKVLSQPGAEPAEILAETIQMFLSRNSTKGDQVAISASGQNTISRFLKLPPVDAKKIPDIIRYEAKQWLPFDLDEVIWDYQPIGLANQSATAVPLNAEVGMFAMKRDVAAKTLHPFLSHYIDVDCIQSSPLAIYNFAAFDQLAIQDISEYDPDNPPDSMVLVSVGTESTDIVITNGFSIWTRSIPIGGSAFTKALTKNLKLTFSKAEYLKRNAAAAQDTKAVFQAMKPVYNDMLNEIHRSLEYYQGLNRRAKFGRILALGNAMKMPGLRQFLTQNLGYEVVRVPQFSRLTGKDVLESPLFKENVFSFAVPYGLVLQQLGEASLTTNLIPKEIVIDRIIREKKPWALVGAAAVMLGLVVQYAGATNALKTISIGEYGTAASRAEQVTKYSSQMRSDTSSAKGVFDEIDNIGRNLTSNVEGRITWLELLRAINAALPAEKEKLDGKKADDIAKQNRLFISNIEAVDIDDLAAWFAPLKEFKKYVPDNDELAEAIAAGGAAPAGDAASTEEAGASAPAAAAGSAIPTKLEDRLALVPGPAAEPGRIVQIVGYHYHNPDKAGEGDMGSGYLRKTFIRNLKSERIILPPTLEKQMTSANARDDVSMRDLGVSYPTLLDIPKIAGTEIINPRVVLAMYLEERREMLKNSRRPSGGGYGGGGEEMSPGLRRNVRRGDESMNSFAGSFANPFDRGESGARSQQGTAAEYLKKMAAKIDAKDKLSLRRFDFVIQFAWVETPPSERERRREELRQAELAKKAEQAAGAAPDVLEGETLPATETTPATPAPEPMPEPETPAPETPAPAAMPETPATPAPAETPPETMPENP